ncbi:Reverse transcriptase domain [Trinorchestia longiramus]|nr:Reverse transcriptase domain [Trinorchestia longiramus]
MTTTDLSTNGLEVTGKIGDHQMIDFSLDVQDPDTRNQHKQILDYKRANFELMKEELGSYNYEVLMNNKNAEECYMILKDKITTATEHLIPRKRIRPTNNPPWFSQEIKRLINARQHSYRRLKRYRTESHCQEHIHACRAVKRTIKSAKRNNEITVAAQAKTKPKSFYKYGANVTIFKKGNKQIPNNHRLISLTSVISKTIERLLKVRITKHLSDQNLINDTKHGFREKRNYLTNLLDFFGEVNRIYDRTKAVDLLYLDFQKAFDRVPHERLMAKVEVHGIRGNYSRWIRNWLTGRTQRVVIHNQASDSALVASGVPQGSVLGPLSSSSTSTILMSESSVKSTNSAMTRNSVTEHSPKRTKQLSNQTSTVFYNGLKPEK